MSQDCLNGFAERFAELKASRHVMQKAVAKECQISERAMRYYAHGDRVLPVDVAARIADYFDVSVDYLIGRSDDPRRLP